MASLMEPGSDFNSIKAVLITIGVNVITDIPAAIIASLFCSPLITYVLKQRQLHQYLGAIIAFFLLDVRRWHFWQAPHLGHRLVPV